MTDSLAEVSRRLSDKWPGRELQIQQLVALLSIKMCPNLLLHGPPSTGKTSVVRHVLSSLKRPHAYVSCTEFSKPRNLLQSVLNQLKAKKRKRTDGYAGSTKTDQLGEIIADFPVMQKAVETNLVVVDHAHRIADQEVLSVLLRLTELTGAKLSVILVSHLSWAAGNFEHSTMRSPRPIQIHFPAYEAHQLANILATDDTSPLVEEFGSDAFKAFLRGEILPVFTRSSRRVEDIQGLVNALYPIYLRPVRDGTVSISESRKLHAMFSASLMAAKTAFESGGAWRGSLAQISESTCFSRDLGRRPGNELGFELPYYSKFLLMAAYICSKNKPTLDKRLFDMGSRAGKRHGQLSHDKQVENAKEAALKGPHSFPFERMLAVFWHLQRSEDESALNSSPHEAEIFLQTSSLISLRLLSKASADELDPKLKCNVSESLATSIAKNLSLRLSDYILYA